MQQRPDLPCTRLDSHSQSRHHAITMSRVTCIAVIAHHGRRRGHVCAANVSTAQQTACALLNVGPFCQPHWDDLANAGELLTYVPPVTARPPMLPDNADLPDDQAAASRDRIRELHAAMTRRERATLKTIMAEFKRMRCDHPDGPCDCARRYVRELKEHYIRLMCDVTARLYEANQTLEEIEPRFASTHSTLHPAKMPERPDVRGIRPYDLHKEEDESQDEREEDDTPESQVHS
jgi:hypothetical protein